MCSPGRTCKSRFCFPQTSYVVLEKLLKPRVLKTDDIAKVYGEQGSLSLKW